MTSVSWDDKYKVGIKIIDEQHKHFIGLLNALYKTLESKNHEKLSDIIHDVAEYADYHFKVEEGYFKKFDYKDAESHKAAHDEIRAKVKEFLHRKDDPSVVGFDMLYFLERWFLIHMKGTDKKYVETFRAHGL